MFCFARSTRPDLSFGVGFLILALASYKLENGLALHYGQANPAVACEAGGTPCNYKVALTAWEACLLQSVNEIGPNGLYIALYNVPC